MIEMEIKLVLGISKCVLEKKNVRVLPTATPCTDQRTRLTKKAKACRPGWIMFAQQGPPYVRLSCLFSESEVAILLCRCQLASGRSLHPQTTYAEDRTAS
jgi:hypothetical protein